MTPAQFVEEVDAVLAVKKDLLGAEAPIWRPGRDVSEKRLKLPLSIDGEQFGQNLVIQAYPDYPTLKFRLGIECLGKIVCRIDYADETHGNNLAPHSLPILVHGPHWHPWELNRSHAGSILSYDSLPYAVHFKEARRFDATLRWYCAKRHINLDEHGITFPPKERLL
jgi:hypothetical protein